MLAGLLIVASLAIALTDGASVRRIGGKATDVCDSPIYCNSDLLKTVQLAGIFNDSKTFVDMSQLHDPDVTVANFNKMMKAVDNKPSRAEVEKYVFENFVMNDELHNWTLPDWRENPSILKRIRDPRYRKWTYELNRVWKNLARKINDDVAEHPDRHSLIYVNNGFIVPGGRFKEFYYWDSYWVIEGLLLCDMHQTAKGMIENFLFMVEKYGFIPNGGRVYYLMRSQPPLLHSMVALYLKHTNDIDFLRTNIGTLEKEFAFWQREKTVSVVKNGKTYKMARYVVESPSPRPESYKEDYNLAQQLQPKDQGNFYNNIKAGAESGWDFSNRWYMGNNDGEGLTLANISTSDIIPVDLNSFLQRNARYLSEFQKILGNLVKSGHYAKIAAHYQAGIDNVLWNEEEGIWFDYDLRNGVPRKSFYPTNLTPLYTSSYNLSKTRDYAIKATKYVKKEKIDTFFGGTPASLNHTGEQWDFPNAWPPLQSIVVNGLYHTAVKEAADIATELASRWLRSNYDGYEEYGKMFEKYDATLPGQGGGGGEYSVQDGFGWTNGIVFEFLDRFPTISPDTHLSEYDSSSELSE